MKGEGAHTTKRGTRPARTCFDRALKLLSLRDHAVTELCRKLAAAGHGDAEISAAIARLGALGYLDDERFADERVRTLSASGKLGRRAIAARLRQAGVAEEIARCALERHGAEAGDELAKARRLVERRFPGLAVGRDARQQAKAARFLAYRGFSNEVICRLLKFEGEP